MLLVGLNCTDSSNNYLKLAAKLREKTAGAFLSRDSLKALVSSARLNESVYSGSENFYACSLTAYFYKPWNQGFIRLHLCSSICVQDFEKEQEYPCKVYQIKMQATLLNSANIYAHLLNSSECSNQTNKQIVTKQGNNFRTISINSQSFSSSFSLQLTNII